MLRKVFAVASALLAVVAGSMSGSTGSATVRAGNTARSDRSGPIEFEQHDLYIEYNATAGDAGLQLGADAESWKRFTLLDPQGRVMIRIDARGRIHRPFELSELFMEASEPSLSVVPFDVFKKRFPEGVYRFRGVTGSGRLLTGSDRLTHLIPGAPDVTFPTEGAVVDPGGFQVRWHPVTGPSGVHIVTYQVIVDQGDRELSMYVPSDVTSVTIPGAFLEPGTELQGEVLARDVSGNQTITELPSFSTGR
jgi:hypothetical protein